MQGIDAPWQKDYTIHGIQVRIGWDDPVLAREMEPILDYCGLAPADTDLSVHHVTLTFLTQAGVLSIPTSACKLGVQNSLAAWQADHQIYFSDGEATVQLDPAAATGMATLHPSPWDRPMALRKDLILYTLLVLLRSWGLYAVHAAGVAKHGVGCLFVAASGSGKSTLTLGLVQQGWAYLSDESLLLRSHGEDVEALSLRRDLYLDPQTTQAFPDVDPHWRKCPLAKARKQRLDVRALYPEQAVLTCMPRVLIFPDIVSEPESRLVPLGNAEAFLRLIHQSVLVLLEPDVIPRHVEILKRVINQTRSYQLFAGRDLANNPALMDRLLADIWEPIDA